MLAALGVLAALAAATSFATAGVLQQRAAARTTEARAISAGLVAALIRQRLWLAGVGLAAASYVLQALALSAQPLTVVQPLLVGEVLLGVPLSARLSGHSLRSREWGALLLVGAGLAAAVWGAAQHRSAGGPGTPMHWTCAGAVVAAATGLLALSARRRSALVRARLYATAAALLCALAAALLTATVHSFATVGLGALAGPAPYGMAVAEIAGMVFLQSAYQAGPLAVSMPLLNWVQPLVAVLLGMAVLGEAVPTGPAHLSVLGLGAMTALAGILLLDRSPRIRAMHADTRLPECTAPREMPIARASAETFVLAA